MKHEKDTAPRGEPYLRSFSVPGVKPGTNAQLNHLSNGGPMSHSSMLASRRKHQATKKRLATAAKEEKKLRKAGAQATGAGAGTVKKKSS